MVRPTYRDVHISIAVEWESPWSGIPILTHKNYLFQAIPQAFPLLHL